MEYSIVQKKQISVIFHTCVKIEDTIFLNRWYTYIYIYIYIHIWYLFQLRRSRPPFGSQTNSKTLPTTQLPNLLRHDHCHHFVHGKNRASFPPQPEVKLCFWSRQALHGAFQPAWWSPGTAKPKWMWSPMPPASSSRPWRSPCASLGPWMPMDPRIRRGGTECLVKEMGGPTKKQQLSYTIIYYIYISVIKYIYIYI